MSISNLFADMELAAGELDTVSGGWTIFGPDNDDYSYSYDSHDDNHNNGQQYVYAYGGSQNSNAVGNESHGSTF